VVGVNVAVDRADIDAQHTFERDGHRIEDGDFQAALACRGRDLGTDPAGADDHDCAAAAEALAQRVGVRDASQVEHAVQISAGNREPSRPGTCRQQQPVVAQPLAVVERQLAVCGVQSHGDSAEA
jgi:hypothetical protein